VIRAHWTQALPAFLVINLCIPAFAEPAPTTLEEAIESASQKNRALRIRDYAVEVAEASRKQMRGNYGPSLSLKSNLQIWDQELAVSFTGEGEGGPTLPPPTTPYEEALESLLGGFSDPTVARGQVTFDFSLTLLQPLTPLWTVSQAEGIREIGVEVAEIERDVEAQTVAHQTSVAFFRALQAEAQVAAAQASIDSLRRQEARLVALSGQGMARESELLRIRVAIAASEEERLAAESSVQLARSNLAFQMGHKTGTTEAAVRPSPLAKAGELPSTRADLDEAFELARRQRAELVVLTKRLEQADKSVDLAWSKMLPVISALAVYQHVEGQIFQPQNSIFAGLIASWTLWEWGGTYYGINEAKAGEAQARAMADIATEQIMLEVRKNWLDLATARARYGVAETALAQAEEAARIEKARYESGTATTTDLLDAESSLAQARTRAIQAYYQCFVAWAGYLKATGQPLTAAVLLTSGGST
jgi:outer membrane protein TolC